MNEKEYIEYYKKLNVLAAVRNSISLICFTILAITFKTWWIVLFAILFTCSVDKD